MPRSLPVRPATRREIRQLHTVLDGECPAGSRRRAEAILLHTAGFPATEIAAALGVHRHTIYADLHAFARAGVACLAQFRTGGAPAQLTTAQRTTICRLAQQPPSAVGLPTGRWTLATLRAYLLRHRVVRAISREHLRRVLKKGASIFGASGARSRVSIPSGARS